MNSLENNYTNGSNIKNGSKKTCLWCEQEFIASRKNTKCCSTGCYTKWRRKISHNKEKEKQKRFDDLAEGIDFICCSICGWKAEDLTSHIRYKHDKSSYHGAIFSKNHLKKRKSAWSGESNPAYNHEGKLSPWSTKFIRGTTNVNIAKKKAVENRINATSIEYFLKKTNGNLEQARELQKKRQAVGSKENFIKRYGNVEGKRKWSERQEKWQQSLNNLPQEEKDRINKAKVSHCGPISKAEKEISTKLYSAGILIETQKPIGKYVYDIVCNENQRIIEYNGEYWHADPRCHDKNWFNKASNNYAWQIWKRDKAKTESAIKNGYRLLTIWEIDYNKDPQTEINKCINFLTQ